MRCWSVLEISPTSAAVLRRGVPHQIRVHMASLHHPLLGDEVYGPSSRPPFPGLKGQVLHAKILGIYHPATGEYMEFDAPLPQYFVDFIAKTKKKKLNFW